MKTVKFEGKTEQEALEKVRDELGLSAIVVSIKKQRKRGLMALFAKPIVIVTAAFAEEETNKDKVLKAARDAAAARQNSPVMPDISTYKPPEGSFEVPYTPPQFDDGKDIQIAHQKRTIKQLEERAMEAEARLAGLAAAAGQQVEAPKPKYSNDMIMMFYDSLVSQGVMPELAEEIIEEANLLAINNASPDINLMVKIVYNKIIGILNEPRILVGNKEGSQVAIFMGPTGVGKTTTIAKLSSILILQEDKRVGLVTSDTYRIAAVDQIKTYADILGLELRVIYDNEEIYKNVVQLKKNNEVVLIDTAGRSHNNEENISELSGILSKVPESDRFLVLSVTTREEDLLSIIETYETISDFELIFTKLDETGSFGTLLNICFLTSKRVSYVSFGQNVPEDIEVIKPDKIAKALMGTGFDAWREA
jgi:flagellar biosynthesis protein FlhF